jgi:hypothetical protein
MKNQHPIFTRGFALFAGLLVAALAADAQPGGGRAPSPQLSGAVEKLFGEHKAFSATLEFQTDGGGGQPAMTVEGNMAYLSGMSRFEMDMSNMKGAAIPPQAVAQMKQMGMDKVVVISMPEKKTMVMIYPSMSAYVESPLPDSAATTTAADFKADVTELGSETVMGHPCTKNKVVATGPDGVAHEFTVWNATDLDKFPVKIETSENGGKMTMNFKSVKLDKPDAAQFKAPSDYKKYDNMMSLMMSRARGGQGSP